MFVFGRQVLERSIGQEQGGRAKSKPLPLLSKGVYDRVSGIKPLSPPHLFTGWKIFATLN
ncbi:hypothetical protein J6590_003567 [Homalodisca vitripennis]|nr:hypothetical protein J6590_003567 [Homalodisca vitripennis]